MLFIKRHIVLHCIIQFLSHGSVKLFIFVKVIVKIRHFVFSEILEIDGKRLVKTVLSAQRSRLGWSSGF